MAKQTKDSSQWEEPKPKKKRSGAYSKTKGSAYERQIVNELKTIANNENICTARSESRNLDNMKIDIADPDNVLPCYFQTKKTQTTPSIKKINAEVGLKDKPLCIIWNAQEKKEGNVNITSAGEYALIPKAFFYELLKKSIETDNSKLLKVMMDFICDMPTGLESIQLQMGLPEEEFEDLIDKINTN